MNAVYTTLAAAGLTFLAVAEYKAVRIAIQLRRIAQSIEAIANRPPILNRSEHDLLKEAKTEYLDLVAALSEPQERSPRLSRAYKAKILSLESDFESLTNLLAAATVVRLLGNKTSGRATVNARQFHTKIQRMYRWALFGFWLFIVP